MTLSCLVTGSCTVILGIVPVFWMYLFIIGVVGLSISFYNTPSTVLLQEKVEAEYLGRVFGVLGMISSSMMPLGVLIFGPMADVIQIESMLIVIGSKDLVEAGKPKFE